MNPEPLIYEVSRSGGIPTGIVREYPAHRSGGQVASMIPQRVFVAVPHLEPDCTATFTTRAEAVQYLHTVSCVHEMDAQAEFEADIAPMR